MTHRRRLHQLRRPAPGPRPLRHARRYDELHRRPRLSAATCSPDAEAAREREHLRRLAHLRRAPPVRRRGRRPALGYYRQEDDTTAWGGSVSRSASADRRQPDARLRHRLARRRPGRQMVVPKLGLLRASCPGSATADVGTTTSAGRRLLRHRRRVSSTGSACGLALVQERRPSPTTAAPARGLRQYGLPTTSRSYDGRPAPGLRRRPLQVPTSAGPANGRRQPHAARRCRTILRRRARSSGRRAGDGGLRAPRPAGGPAYALPPESGRAAPGLRRRRTEAPQPRREQQSDECVAPLRPAQRDAPRFRPGSAPCSRASGSPAARSSRSRCPRSPAAARGSSAPRRGRRCR